MKYVNYRRIENYAKTLEKRNLNRYGFSRSWVTILDLSKIATEVGDGYRVVYDDWHERMKAVAMPSKTKRNLISEHSPRAGRRLK